MNDPMPPEPRILVIRRRYLGDIVLLGILAANLRRHRPAARIVALLEPAYAPVLALNPDFDEVIPLPDGAFRWPGFLRKLRSMGFTHVFDLDNSARTALITRLSAAPFRATLHLENVKRHAPASYTHSVFVRAPQYAAQSIVETQLGLLGPAGVPVSTHELRLVPRQKDLESAQRLLGGPREGSGKRPARVLVHPGSRSECRIWPADAFASVCDRIQDDLGAQVFLLAGPNEGSIVSAVRQSAKSHLVSLPAAADIATFAAIASEVDVLLCHDSGPMHVAAAVGTPVVALFGSQNATVWRPIGERHVVLQPPLPCEKCVAPEVCVREDSYRNYCVQNISVDRVVEALATVIR